jgi:hypothetical protein
MTTNQDRAKSLLYLIRNNQHWTRAQMLEKIQAILEQAQMDAMAVSIEERTKRMKELHELALRSHEQRRRKLEAIRA